MNTYQDLKVWQFSIDLVVDIYKATNKFPKSEQFGLTSQMRRAAVSIPANLAEGYCRQSRQDYIRFVKISFASGAELETHLLIAEKLGFLSQETYDKLIKPLTVIMRMLNKLIFSLVPSA